MRLLQFDYSAEILVEQAWVAIYEEARPQLLKAFQYSSFAKHMLTFKKEEWVLFEKLKQLDFDELWKLKGEMKAIIRVSSKYHDFEYQLTEYDLNVQCM